MNSVLSSDKNVFKVNNMVRRPLEKWSPNIHSLLEHFYNIGLPVPRLIKKDNQYEYLEYIDGEMIHPRKWNKELLYKIAILLKDIHNSARSFKNEETREWTCSATRLVAEQASQNAPLFAVFNGSCSETEVSEQLQWKTWCLRELGHPIICSHGDIAPWNIITRDNDIVGIIDWEMAGPIDPVIELARVCWLFTQLFDDDVGTLYHLPSPRERADEVRLIVDTYGLGKNERKVFFDKIMEVIICETAHEAIDGNITFDSVGKLWGMAWRNRSLYWILRNKDIITKALE